MIQEKHKWILEELKILKKKSLISKPRKRAQKGYANFPIKWSIEGNFKDYGKQETGSLHKAYATYNIGEIGGIITIDRETIEKSRQVLLKKALEHPEYIPYRKYLTDKYGKMLLDFCLNELSKENIESASKQKLWELYNKFREIYTKYDFYNGIWFRISDQYLDKIIKRLEKHNLNFNELQTISTCSIQTFTNREKIDLLKIAIKILENEIAKKIIQEGRFEEFQKIPEYNLLTELKKEYHWIPFGHVGPELFDEQHYFNEIKKLIEENIDLKEELEKTINFYPNIRKKQQEIYNKYNIDEETKTMIRNLHLLCIMQDDRKELIGRSHVNWTNNLMGKIGLLFNLQPHEAANIYPNDIENALLNNKISLGLYRKEKESNKNFKITEPDGYTVYFDEDAQEFLDIILGKEDKKELTGMTACEGFAKGKVKVLLDANEGKKMEKGNILVTTMTTPDFVPFMGKAAAIITDEGGVTCHAAIVSREMGIPCIVGTDNATEILKDGDLVEVDATNRIIKKIIEEK